MTKNWVRGDENKKIDIVKFFLHRIDIKNFPPTLRKIKFLLTESSYWRNLFWLWKLRAIFNFFVLHFGSTIASFNEKNRHTLEKWTKIIIFFDEFKTWSKKFRFLRVPEKFFWAQKNLWGSSTLQNLNFGYKNRYLSPKDQGEISVGS